jgi:hypothetical protein
MSILRLPPDRRHLIEEPQYELGEQQRDADRYDAEKQVLEQARLLRWRLVAG